MIAGTWPASAKHAPDVESIPSLCPLYTRRTIPAINVRMAVVCGTLVSLWVQRHSRGRSDYALARLTAIPRATIQRRRHRLAEDFAGKSTRLRRNSVIRPVGRCCRTDVVDRYGSARTCHRGPRRWGLVSFARESAAESLNDTANGRSVIVSLDASFSPLARWLSEA
jgi:hypothetical protein